MKRIVLLALLAVLLPAHARAQERIRAYDTDIAVQQDGSLRVTERITVHAEGTQIRRGIYRDVPTRYRDRYGNRVRVELDVIGVERDGRPEAWFTERLGNGIRINTGGDDFLPTLPADYTYTIHYRTTRQLGFFDDHDELYWNAIGTGWVFPIESGTVTVRLPQPVPMEQMSAEGYTGPQGAQGSAYTASITAPGTATYALTAPLAPNEGFTVVLTFPKGIIAEPTATERSGWFLRDNLGVLVALVGLMLLLLYTFRTWARIGRDPAPGIIIPRYVPPAGLTPASLRLLSNMSYDMRCFSADLLALAVAGHVRIYNGGRKSKWLLERTGATRLNGYDGPTVTAVAAPQEPALRELLDGLFPDGSRELLLYNTNASIVSAAKSSHADALSKEMKPRYFNSNRGSVLKAIAIGVATLGAALVLSGGNGVPVIMGLMLVMIVVLVVFDGVVRAPTPEGRRLLDEIEGLKLYLSVAERDEIARLQGPESPPDVDARRYEELLPYAVALDVEDAWTDKFTAAAGAAAVEAATQHMTWYAGSGRGADIGSFTRAIGSTLTSSISSAATPPGSSSGSGGGGSSGGGGGGGGGGGR